MKIIQRKKANNKKRLIALDIFVAVATVGLITLGLVYKHKKNTAELCNAPGKTYQLSMQKDEFSQKTLTVQQCDIVKIVDLDNQDYYLAFGQHDNHISYPDFREQIIAGNESVNIDALQTGTYEVHDHYRDKAKLELKIQKPTGK